MTKPWIIVEAREPADRHHAELVSKILNALGVQEKVMAAAVEKMVQASLRGYDVVEKLPSSIEGGSS